MSFLFLRNTLRIGGDLFKVPARSYAARKGTRERKQKKKVKVEVEKVGFIPHNLRKKEKLMALRASKKFDDSWKRKPLDNVFHIKFFQLVAYPFQEAARCHMETHHPDMYNKPNANLHVSIELDMQGEKKTRFVDDFTRIVDIPHKFDHGEERSILVFSKTEESQKEATDAGANLAGGTELIKRIQTGDISLQDFQFVLAHPDILSELVTLRGLLKKKFPNPRNGTLSVDIAPVVNQYLNGIKYSAKKDDYEKDFGLIETIVGTLDMTPAQLEENFKALIKDINTMRPKREGHFISRCLLWSPPSREKLKINHQIYLPDEKQAEDEDDEAGGERVAL